MTAAETTNLAADTLQLSSSALISALLALPPPPPSQAAAAAEETSLSTLPAPRRFADKVLKLGANEDEWKIAGRKKKTKKPAVVGTDHEGGLKGVAPSSLHFAQFSVTYLDESTTIDEIRRHLHTKGIEVKQIWLLNSKVKGAKTAKVRVEKEQEMRAKNPAIWPLHSRVRDWDFTRTEREVTCRPGDERRDI